MGNGNNERQQILRCHAQSHDQSIIAVCFDENCKNVLVQCSICKSSIHKKCKQSLTQNKLQRQLVNIQQMVQDYLRSQPQINEKQLTQMTSIVDGIGLLLQPKWTKEQWMQGYLYLKYEQYIRSLTKYPEDMNSKGVCDCNRRIQGGKSDELFCCAILNGQVHGYQPLQATILVSESYHLRKSNPFWDYKLYQWDPVQPYNQKTWKIWYPQPSYAKFIPNIKILMFLDDEDNLYLQNETGELNKAKSQYFMRNFICQSNGRKFVCSSDRHILIFNLKTLKCIKARKICEGLYPSSKLEFVFGEQLVIASSNKQKLSLIMFDVGTGKIVRRLTNGFMLHDFSCCYQRAEVLVLGWKQALMLDLLTAKYINSLMNIMAIRYARYSPNGNIIVGIEILDNEQSQSQLRFWNAKSGAILQVKAPIDQFYGFDFMFDGQLLVCQTEDNIKIFDISYL